MHTKIYWRGQTLPDANEIANLLPYIESHTFDQGIYLVKRAAVVSKGAEHYGFAVIGEPLKHFNLPTSTPMVIHKTNLGVHAEPFEPFEWEKVEKLKGNVIDAVYRANESYLEAYNLLFNNCEHFARKVVTGIKESSQVRNFAILAGVAMTIYFASRSDH